MPLHFVVPFVQGTHGWHLHMKKRNKNLSPSEFYAYHMMKRNTDSDYLLNGGRLYQELILFAWTTAELSLIHI